jgi:signal recognition particle subunit SRP54
MVIVDTAGRLGVDEELMKQAIDIRDAVNRMKFYLLLMP